MNIQMAKAALAKHRDGKLACAFLDHLQATGLSQGRVATYGNRLRVVLRYIDKADVHPKTVGRTEAERLMAIINGGRYERHSTFRPYRPTQKAARVR